MASGDIATPPAILWAQRKDMVFLTINLEDCKDPVIDLKPDYLHFRGIGGTEKLPHEVKVEFYADVNPEQSRFDVQPRHIALAIRKKSEAPYWPRLMKQTTKVHWLKTDFNKWKDEDDSDDDPKEDDLADMMSKMNQYKGDEAFNTNGMEDDEEDSDDEPIPDLEEPATGST